MSQKVASVEGLHSLPFIQQFEDTYKGCKTHLLRILGQVCSGVKMSEHLASQKCAYIVLTPVNPIFIQ